MSTMLSSGGLNSVSFLSTYRETVTRETGIVVLNESVDDAAYRAEAFGRVAALLASSLEELKVAEQELLERNDELLKQYQECQQRIEHERRLFHFAPCALLVTNLVGTITDANDAATALLGRAASSLDHKPLATLVPLEDRPAFRTEFNRISLSDGTTDWQFRVLRARDVPLRVSAAVQVVGRTETPSGAGLIWSIRPVPAAEGRSV